MYYKQYILETESDCTSNADASYIPYIPLLKFLISCHTWNLWCVLVFGLQFVKYIKIPIVFLHTFHLKKLVLKLFFFKYVYV